MPSQHIRILGITEKALRFENGRYVGTKGVVYNTLGKHFDLVGVGSFQLSKLAKRFSQLTHFRTERSRWRFAASLNPWTFRYRTRAAERYLQQHEGAYDLIVQMDTLLAPGLRLQQRPYTLVTDNTYALTHRYWPDWAPMTKRDHREWLRLETEVYQNARFLFVWSEFARQSMIQDYGVTPDKVAAVGCGANLYVETLDRRGYDSRTALFVGNDFERKGGFVLLRAWGQVHKKMPDAQLWIVGPRSPLADPQPGVKWLGQVSDRQELQNLYNQAALFVMPSLFEPWGMVFMEAMGSGLACIGTDKFGMVEFIEHDKNGMIVPMGQDEPLAEALLTILGDPALAEQMGRAAHATILSKYTWDAVIERMVPHIQRVAEAQKSP